MRRGPTACQATALCGRRRGLAISPTWRGWSRRRSATAAGVKSVHLGVHGRSTERPAVRYRGRLCASGGRGVRLGAVRAG